MLSGILSPIFVEWRKKIGERKEIKKAIRTELDELKTRLTTNVYTIELGFGTYDRNLLKWLLPKVKDITEIHPKENILASIEEHLNWDDEKIGLFARSQRKPDGAVLFLREIATSFLDSRIGSLSMFSVDEQRLLLEIRYQINVINDDVNRTKIYTYKTFESSISSNNMKIIERNIINTYLDISKKTQQVADRIEQFLSQHH